VITACVTGFPRYDRAEAMREPRKIMVTSSGVR